MTRAADRLGTGTSFSTAGRERSPRGRAKAIAQGDIPPYELVRLPLDEVSPTPLNPRRNFGDDEDKTRFGEELRQGQLAACVVVTRDVYLALWPEHGDLIEAAANHVLVNGERRYRSAVHVGLEALDFVVRDDLASSREEFVNSLLKENLEREDFDVIERARGVEQLVKVCTDGNGRGGRARASERLGKDRSWVTNQLALLTLPVEIQSMLTVGTLPERDGRHLARRLKDQPGLGAAELLAFLKETKAQEAQAKAEEKVLLAAAKEATSPSGLLSADNNPGAGSPVDGESSSPAPSKTAAPTPTSAPAEPDTSADELLSADNNPGAGSPVDGESSSPAPSKATPQAPAPAPAGSDPSPEGLLSADNNPGAEATVPHQSTGEAWIEALRWDDPLWFDRELRKRMSPENRQRLVWLLGAAEDA